MAEAAGKAAKVGLSLQKQLQFHGRPALARTGQSLYGAAALGILS
jgi:hypothetical protein